MDELAAARRSWQKLSEWTERHEEDIAAAYEQVGSYETVAEHVGRSPEGVRQVLKRRGVTLRRRGRPRKQE